MAAALVTTLHETNKVARCHFENGCFTNIKNAATALISGRTRMQTRISASMHHSGACYGFMALLDDSEAPRPVKLAFTAVHLKRTRILMLVNLVPLKYLSKSVYFKNNSLKTNTTSFFIVFDVV